MSTVIAMALVPIFCVLLLGYTAGRFAVIDNMRVGVLNTVVMTYALPAALLATTANTARSAMRAQWPVFVVLGVAMMLVYPLWYLYQRRVLRRPMGEAAAQALTVALPNVAGAGFPVAAALFGAGHGVPVAVAVAAGALLPSPVTLALLELAQPAPEGRRGAAAVLGRAIALALCKPIVLTPALGVAISLSGWQLPAVVTASLQLLGQAAVGMALFVTGLILSVHRFRPSLNAALGTLVINVVRPLLALGVARALHVPVEAAKVSVLLAALPAGFFGILFGTGYGVPVQDASATVITSTLASLLTLAWAIGWLYG